MERQPHILALPGDVTPYALLPGDPGRVDRVAKLLSNPREISHNREYRLLTGLYGETPVTVLSTGIGGPSLAIGVEELWRCGVRTAIRIGSAGALQTDMMVGHLVIAEGAVREEGTSLAYQPVSFPAVPAPEVYYALTAAAQRLHVPYGSGLIRSHDSFYRNDEEQLCLEWHNRGVLAADMESAALFVVGRTRGMRTGSIVNTVVTYGGDLEGGIGSLTDAEPARRKGEENEIRVALEALHLLHIGAVSSKPSALEETADLTASAKGLQQCNRSSSDLDMRETHSRES